MNILFVHQSFPGQYRHILRALAAQGGHRLVGLGIAELSEPLPEGVAYLRYELSRGNTAGLHDWLLDVDSKLIRGEACAKAAVQLRDQGFVPDLICAHPGWGEALFLRDVWPAVPLLCYQEFFYNARGVDYDFDPELQGIPDWQACARLRLKNANPLLMLQASSWNITPTQFQRSTFPPEWQSRISVIHDGIDTQLAAPDPAVAPLSLPDGTVLAPGEATITFVNRRIEPYRGCHTLIRAIPEIQRRHPQARIVVVGATEGVSYGKPAPGDRWRDVFLQEIEGSYNPARVHFTGSLAYGPFLQLLKLSACHAYLTYPFVLSWSLLEAMSTGLPIVGSATAPVQEVIRHGETGLLVDFFSPAALAEAVSTLLTDRALAARLGEQARQLVLHNFSLQQCVPRQLSLMQLVASGALR
ncbi:MAG: glycosyl transferase family 1 [Synechococcus sp. XM-24]|nr:MAG: glycosyl transferase family 1 [Synechococcus sp. XM-24]